MLWKINKKEYHRRYTLKKTQKKTKLYALITLGDQSGRLL